MTMEKQGGLAAKPVIGASGNLSGIHLTNLPESHPGDVFFHEWNVYRREVGRWLAEGQADKHVLIKDQEVMGIFNIWEEAQIEALRRYESGAYFIHPICEEEPYLRVRGVNFPWLSGWVP